MMKILLVVSRIVSCLMTTLIGPIVKEDLLFIEAFHLKLAELSFYSCYSVKISPTVSSSALAVTFPFLPLFFLSCSSFLGQVGGVRWGAPPPEEGQGCY